MVICCTCCDITFQPCPRSGQFNTHLLFIKNWDNPVDLSAVWSVWLFYFLSCNRPDVCITVFKLLYFMLMFKELLPNYPQTYSALSLDIRHRWNKNKPCNVSPLVTPAQHVYYLSLQSQHAHICQVVPNTKVQLRLSGKSLVLQVPTQINK